MSSATHEPVSFHSRFHVKHPKGRNHNHTYLSTLRASSTRRSLLFVTTTQRVRKIASKTKQGNKKLLPQAEAVYYFYMLYELRLECGVNFKYCLHEKRKESGNDYHYSDVSRKEESCVTV